MIDNPAAPDADSDDPVKTPDQVAEEQAAAAHDANVAAAQEREEDPDGDPDALDPGDLNEAPSDVDPPEAQQINPDADDDLSEVAADETDNGIEDFSEAEDTEADPDPEAEPEREADPDGVDDGSLDGNA